MILKLQVSAQGDNALPRDNFVITPHFEVPAVIADADSLCQDLADALNDWMNDKREIIVKAYDAQGTVPVYPIGVGVASAGLAPPSTSPREVAICLSFYSQRNIPRNRGRLYIPHTWMGGAIGVRPAAQNRTTVGSLAQIFADLGGVDVDWVVFSRSDNDAKPVSNWWVDDEWDTMRSRGLRPTTRLTGTVGE